MDPADAGIVIPGFAAWASLKHRNGGGHEQRAVWCQTIEFDEDGQQARQIALFADDRQAPALNCDVVHVRLSGLRLVRPRQWGACWLASHVWDQLRLDAVVRTNQEHSASVRKLPFR